MKKYVKLFSLIIMCSTLFMINTLSVMGTENEELGSWETKEAMKTKRIRMGVVEANNKIYAIGGYYNYDCCDDVEEYDPETNTWITKAPMITPRDYLEVVEVNNKIYAIGGRINGPRILTTIEEYDIESNRWFSKPNMTTPRYAFGAAEVNGKIYIIGGYDGYKRLNTVEEYDPETNKWTTKANMPTTRMDLKAVSVNGKIYAIGGNNEKSQVLDTVEEYDPQTDKWTTKTSMITPRHEFGVAEVNGKIYAICGKGDNGSYGLNTVEEYDPETNNWIIKANMPTTRCRLGASAVNGKIYAIGGYSTVDNKYLNTVEEFTPFNYSKNETLELKSIDKMKIGQEVTVDAILHNVDNIYAEDFTVTYDQDIFEYIGYEEIEGLKVVKPLNTEGILRFIIASKGKDKSVDGSEIIAKLKFRAKQAGVSKIDATKARIANIETEWDLEEDNCGETTITVEGSFDVNRTNEFTLVDLAIDGYYFNMLAENTDKEKYDADVVVDGTINDEDLLAIVDEMLNNSNYEPNNK